MAVLASASESSVSRREAFVALKARLSDATLTAPPLSHAEVIPTAVPALDRLLGGGFALGALTALEGSAGRWSIAARLVAQVTRRAMAAIIDDGGLYPPSLARAGVRLDRVLIVPARTPLAVARAADILVRSRTCRLVLMPAIALRDAIWTRLARLAHRMGVLLVAIATHIAAPLAVPALRLRCTREQLVLHGSRSLWATIAGYTVRAELRKNSKRTAGARAHVRIVEPLAGAVSRERDIIRRTDEAHAALR